MNIDFEMAHQRYIEIGDKIALGIMIGISRVTKERDERFAMDMLMIEAVLNRRHGGENQQTEAIK